MKTNKKTKILSPIKKLISPWYQLKLFTQFCGVLMIIWFIVMSGYKTAEAYFDYMAIFSHEIVEVKIARASEDTTIYTANMSVQDKIKFYATVFGVNKNDALRIAQCESNFNPLAENVNGSATGVYQFIRKTWKNNCHGDIYNEDHNIICFMENYPKNKDWWECK